MEEGDEMNVEIDNNQSSQIAIINDKEIILSSVQDALDLMATISYEYGCYKIIIHKSAIIDDFFDLKTGLAGEILQKYINYGVKIAIIGDFSEVSKKSLRDFIYESNNGNDIFFLGNMPQALDILHSK